MVGSTKQVIMFECAIYVLLLYDVWKLSQHTDSLLWPPCRDAYVYTRGINSNNINSNEKRLVNVTKVKEQYYL